MSLVLPFEQWPAADRAQWDALFREGGPLDDRGPLAHYRDTSRHTLSVRYGRWMKWLEDRDPLALSDPPIARVTLSRLRLWLEDLQHTAPMTQLAFIEAVARVGRAANPTLDWTAPQRLVSRLKRAAGRGRQTRKVGRVLSSDVLLDAGQRLTMEIAPQNPRAVDGATEMRDGAMIAVLALMPMRLRALANLRLGESVFISTDRISIALPADLTKTGVPWEADVPDQILPILHTYLQEARPFLQARAGTNDPHLWLARHGRALAIGAFYPQLVKQTQRLTGVKVSPHLFRAAAATTLARMSPQAARLIPPVLAHNGFGTAEKHYIHAQTIDAGRDYAALIARHKETHK